VAAIETIAGTNRVIEGQQEGMGSGVRAGVMLDFLKRETMRSKSPMLQDFEASLESVAQNMLIEMSLSLSEEDSELTERLKVAARKHSGVAIQSFTGQTLRDNVHVSIDIASELLRSPEAQQQKAIEILQFAQERLTPAQFAALLEQAGMKNMDVDVSPQLDRAKKMVSRIVSGFPEHAFPMLGIDREDVFLEVIQNAILEDKFHDYEMPVKQKLVELLGVYQMSQQKKMKEQEENQIRMLYLTELAKRGEFPSERVRALVAESGEKQEKEEGEEGQETEERSVEEGETPVMQEGKTNGSKPPVKKTKKTTVKKSRPAKKAEPRANA